MMTVNKRKVSTCILLSILTLGLYSIYWAYLLIKNIHALEKDGKGAVKELLCLLFVPLYAIYWWFTRGKTVREKLTARGCSPAGNENAYLILSVLFLGVISMAIMQNDFNALPENEAEAREKSAFTLRVRTNLMLFCYELQKLKNSRYFVILLLLLFVANTLVCASGAVTQDKAAARALDELCAKYDADPEGCTAELEALKAQIYAEMEKRYEEMLSENARRREEGLTELDPASAAFVSTTIDGESDDLELIAQLYERREVQTRFEEEIDGVISASYMQMRAARQADEATDTYAYRYQLYVYNRYLTVKNETSLGVQNVYGWGEFFSYTYVDVFLFAAMLLLSCVIFVPEKQSGVLPIMRTARHGRGRTAVAKTAAALTASGAITLSFLLAEILVLSIKCGFSSASAPIQSIEAFKLFPYAISVLGYAGLFVLMKLLVFAAFTLAAVFFSSLLYQPVISYAVGALLFGVSYYLNTRSFVNYPELKMLNLLSAAQLSPIADRPYTVNFFSFPFDCFLAAGAGCILLIVLFFVSTVLLFAHKASGVQLRFLSVALKKLRAQQMNLSQKLSLWEAKRVKARKKRSHGLFYWESRKLLRFGCAWLILLVLLCAQIVRGVAIEKDYMKNYEHLLYNAIIDDYKGELTEEKAARIRAEEAELRETAREGDWLDMKLRQQEITEEEYEKKRPEAEEAKTRLASVEVLLKQVEYLEKKYEESGERGWLCDTFAYENYFYDGVDLPLFAALLLLSAFSFAIEYQGKGAGDNFAQILRSTPHGRKKTFLCKHASVQGAVFLLSLLFAGLRLLFFAVKYDFSSFSLSAPLFSINAFENYNGGMTVGGYFACILLTRIFSPLLFTFFIVALSAHLGRLLPIIGTALVTLAVPSLLASFGWKSAQYFNFAGLFGANDLASFSFEIDWFGFDFGFAILFALSFAASTLLLTFTARRKFVK